MGQDFNAYAGASSVDTNIQNVIENTDTLRSSFSGTSAPTGPVVGQLWIDTSGSQDILKVYGDLYGTGNAWYEVSSVLHGDLDLGGDGTAKQLVNARAENLGAHVTPSAGNLGRVYYHTGEEKALVVTTSAKREHLWSAKNTDYQRVELPIDSWGRDATNPPTVTAIGTTPTIRGWLFDATNEKAGIFVRVPQGYSGDADLKLRLFCLLNATETGGDDIDWTLNWESRAPAANEPFGGTSTSATVAQDCPTNVTQYTSYMVDLTIDFDDATNPVAAGDLLALEIARTNLSTVAGVIVVGAELLVPSGTKATE